MPMTGRKSGWIPEGGELLAGRQVRGPRMPVSRPGGRSIGGKRP